ncbi:unnamed protein product [Prorocentrum cordatum]|nr:unnamed protein product [Polarella glacialis]
MAAEGKFFGASKFDPRLISTQIVVMQAAFWFCFAGVYSIANWIIGAPQSLSQMFVGKGYTWATTPGLALACSLWATTFAMVAALRIVVERAKKCLDFVATYHIFHLVATCFVSGFPSELHWWVIHAAALIVAVVVGEYVCMLGDIDVLAPPRGAPPRRPRRSRWARRCPRRRPKGRAGPCSRCSLAHSRGSPPAGSALEGWRMATEPSVSRTAKMPSLPCSR